MSLTEQLNKQSAAFAANAPEPVKNIIMKARADLASTFDPSFVTIKVGSALPQFQLKNAKGEETSSTSLLQSGALLIIFYRGSWCPFCSLTLRSFSQKLKEFRAKGVTLIAISPELPDTSLSMVEKNELKYPVLTDLHNEYAEKLGIVYHQPETLRPAFEKFGTDLKARNGSDTLDVPIPTTILVDREGVVRNYFLDTDYTKRLEPATALEWAAMLSGIGGRAEVGNCE